MNKEILISTKDLCKCFVSEQGEQYIISHLDLEIYKNDFTVIMGASGSGKSTLLYHLSGLDTPTSGSINFSGTEITGLTTDQMAKFRRNKCGYVFQQNCLIDELTVMDNVLTAGYMADEKRSDIIKRAKELFRKVEVQEITESKYPSQISKGRGQRVAIIRALINHPDVLFADEPTGALNSKTSKEVMDIFTSFNREGQSIIMVTHDVVSAVRGNRVIYFKDGRIIDECSLGAYDGDDMGRIQKLNEFLMSMGW